MMKGNIKWYNQVKGYGFIQTSENADVFVHRSGLELSGLLLEPGQPVEFELADGQKGPMAVHVKKAE